MEYRPYTPQPLDESEDAAAPGRSRAEPAEDFRPSFEIVPGEQAQFEDGPRVEPDSETDFASIKFQRENTLLTNAESYAASIREEAQLYVRQLRGEVEALNQQAEERYQEAERIKAEAQVEAERMLAEARSQVDNVRSEAHEEGHRAGMEEGMRRRYDEAAPLLERLEAVLEEISAFRRRVAFYTEKDSVRLAMLIARRIVQAELKVNKQVVAKLLAASLAKLQGKGTFRVWLSPEDHQFITSARESLQRFLDDDQTLVLRAQPDLRPGNVLIETDREVIDLTFESQFYHLERQFRQTLDERESMLLSRKVPPPEPPGQDSDQTAAAPQASAAARPAARGAARTAAQPAPKPAAKPASRPAAPARPDATPLV